MEHAAVIDPPEIVPAGVLVLRRPTLMDADQLAQAVSQSLAHLAPWMPWATPGAATVDAQRRRLSEDAWSPGDYHYVMVKEGGGIVGGCGLHGRGGPGSVEIGYWVHSAHVRHGYATEAAAALTRTALSLLGIDRVEIHCDEANLPSAAVARRLGYQLDRIEDHTIDSPAQTGRFQIWVTPVPAP